MKVSDEFLCVFSSQIHQQNNHFIVEVPDREIELGGISEGSVYRVGILPAADGSQSSQPESKRSSRRTAQEPPVEAGDTLEVEIEDIGDQGDGIARIDSGYVVFVPDTTLHERVTIEITDAHETMAFADVVGSQDR